MQHGESTKFRSRYIVWELKELKWDSKWHRGYAARGPARAKRYYKDQLTRQLRNHNKKILDQEINEE